MKLLHVITSMDPTLGGPNQGLRNIARQVQLLGFQPEVLCLNDATSSFLKDLPFPVHGLGEWNNSWAYHAPLKPWLQRHLHRYDVVVLHGIWQYPNLAVWRVLQKLRRQGGGRRRFPRLLVMPHGMLDPYFQKSEGRKLKALRNQLYWQLIQQRVINGADGLLFTTRPELELARTTFKGYQPRRELLVGYGIQPPPFYVEDMRLAFHTLCPGLGEKPYLLFLGRIHEKKGADILLQAYATVLEAQLPGQQHLMPHLVLAGPGMNSPHGATLQALIDGMPVLTGRVHCCGMLQGPAKWGALYGADVFLLPSHQENFGIAVVEALACGVPALVSKEVNIYSEILAAGAGMAAADTLEGTQALLQQWLTTPAAIRQEMRDNAIQLFRTQFEVSATGLRFAQTLWQLVHETSLPQKLWTATSIKTPTQALPFPAATALQG